MKEIILLGATGSIGSSVFKVLDTNPLNFKLIGISSNTNYKDLAKYANKYKPKYVSICDESKIGNLKTLLNYDPIIFGGRSGLLELSSIKVDLLINAIIGFAGLEPTVKSIEAKSNIALANKESMVVAGVFINELLIKNKVSLIPIDSEHNAIFQCLKGNETRPVNKVYITASGGPFLNKDLNDFNNISVHEALNHPTWGMGKKISIDSATMANKVLEIIEAINLFKFDHEQIKVLIHPQSIVHGMLEFVDGSVLSLLSPTCMTMPIKYAMSYPNYLDTSSGEYLDLTKVNKLEFIKVDNNRYPMMSLVEEVLSNIKVLPCAFNAANEVGVNAFINGKISFNDIYSVIYKTIKGIKNINIKNIEDIIGFDKEIRIKSNEIISRGS